MYCLVDDISVAHARSQVSVVASTALVDHGTKTKSKRDSGENRSPVLVILTAASSSLILKVEARLLLRISCGRNQRYLARQSGIEAAKITRLASTLVFASIYERKQYVYIFRTGLVWCTLSRHEAERL